MSRLVFAFVNSAPVGTCVAKYLHPHLSFADFLGPPSGRDLSLFQRHLATGLSAPLPFEAVLGGSRPSQSPGGQSARLPCPPPEKQPVGRGARNPRATDRSLCLVCSAVSTRPLDRSGTCLGETHGFEDHPASPRLRCLEQSSPSPLPPNLLIPCATPPPCIREESQGGF